jgi:hypothetical protein
MHLHPKVARGRREEGVEGGREGGRGGGREGGREGWRDGGREGTSRASPADTCETMPEFAGDSTAITVLFKVCCRLQSADSPGAFPSSEAAGLLGRSASTSVSRMDEPGGNLGGGGSGEKGRSASTSDSMMDDPGRKLGGGGSGEKVRSASTLVSRMDDPGRKLGGGDAGEKEKSPPCRGRSWEISSPGLARSPMGWTMSQSASTDTGMSEVCEEDT